ncbi:MAG: glycosyltransferase [Planctomycetales bacterium]|nr:glycosyltransferase [Planctomycetales bacterium]
MSLQTVAAPSIAASPCRRVAVSDGSSDGPRILFGGGGTGGHLLPGIATAEAIARLEPRARFLFLGTGRPVEERLLAPRAWPRRALPCAPPGLRPAALARFLWRTGRGLAGALGEVGRFGPDACLGLGGYGSVAPVLAAALRGVPCLLLEQNAVPGLATKALAPAARGVLGHFPEALAPFGPRGKVTGSPLRVEVLAPRTGSPFPPGAGPALLALGGSQGARGLNRLVSEALPALAAVPGLRLLLLAGDETEAASLGGACRAAGIVATTLPFLHEMGAAYRAADLVLARAGGMTIAEIAAVGRPAVLVPLPTAKGDHQQRNAESLAGRGAAVVFEESAGGTALGGLLARLLGDPVRLEGMREAARRCGRPDAAAAVAREILALTARRRRAIVPVVNGEL